MLYLLIILTPILIVDLLNPILLAGTVYGLGSRRPIVNGSTVLISFFVTYFLAGIVIAISLEIFIDFFHIPHGFDYLLELAVAALLFYSAWSQKKETNSHPEEKLKHDEGMTLKEAALLGLQINLVGLPFAIPYLAAIDQILKAEISVIKMLSILLLYNIAYILPFTLLIFLRILYQKKSDAIFKSINVGIQRFSDKYMPVILFILGVLLVEDALSYFLGYREYSLLSLI